MKRVLLALVLFVLSFAPTHAATAPAPNHLQWDLTRIGAPAAWSVGADGHGVRVLVIDTGLDKTLATTALSGSILPSMSVNPLHGRKVVQCPPGDFTSGTCYAAALVSNPSAYVDGIGHGSFVVSEIVGHGASYQFYGVAPKAKVAMAKVFGNGDSADSADIAHAIDWGVLYHFDIISMSIGGGDDPVERAAVARAIAAGVLVVAASGNAGAASPSYPAAYPGVISVGASDRWDHPASWSNKGATLLAPGDFVWGLAPMHSTFINCGGFCLWEGTSMATPEVAGALADLLSAGLTHAQAKVALLAGARRWDRQDMYLYGDGILDLNGALRVAKYHHWGHFS